MQNQLITETRWIGGEEGEPDAVLIRSTKLPSIAGLKLSARLGRMFAPGLSKAGDIDIDPAAIGAMNIMAIMPVFGELFRNLDEKDIEPLLISVFQSTQAQVVAADGAPKLVPLVNANAINLIFGPRFDDVLAAAWFALELNYGNFISGALDKLRAKHEAKAAAEAAAKAAAKVASE